MQPTHTLQNKPVHQQHPELCKKIPECSSEPAQDMRTNVITGLFFLPIFSQHFSSTQEWVAGSVSTLNCTAETELHWDRVAWCQQVSVSATKLFVNLEMLAERLLEVLVQTFLQMRTASLDKCLQHPQKCWDWWNAALWLSCSSKRRGPRSFDLPTLLGAPMNLSVHPKEAETKLPDFLPSTTRSLEFTSWQPFACKANHKE